MGPQQRLGIYVGFGFPSIIRYLEPLIGDESAFLLLWGEKWVPKERREIAWNAPTISHFDPRTNQCELEVQRIIHLQNLVNQLPYAFIDTKKVSKSHISVANALARIDVPK